MIEKLIVEIYDLLTKMAPFLILGFFIAGILSTIISPETIEKHLSGKGILPIIKASIFGIPLPLCSCGVIPVATSLYRKGANRSSTTSFLVSTPQTGIDSIILSYAFFGPIFMMIRPISALIAGVFSGFLTEIINPGVSDDNSVCENHKNKKQINKLMKIFNYAFITLPQDIAKPLITGIFLASLIGIFVPSDYFVGTFSSGMIEMLAVLIISIPLYVCATASIPIAAVLMAKGMSAGAAFVFLMAGPATNMATITTIWSTLGKKSSFIYLFSVSLIAMITGILMNTLFIFNSIEVSHYHNHLYSILDHVITIFFIIIIVNALFKFYPKQHSNINYNLVINIKGMTCSHCQESVSNAIYSNNNIKDVVVDLSKSKAYIDGTKLNSTKIIDSIEAAGFQAKISN